VVRQIDPDATESLVKSAEGYVSRAREYMRSLAPDERA
jgi:hypothetical protein